MAHISGILYVTSGSLFADNVDFGTIRASAIDLGLVASPVPVGDLDEPYHRVYTGASDGTIYRFGPPLDSGGGACESSPGSCDIQCWRGNDRLASARRWSVVRRHGDRLDTSGTGIDVRARRRHRRREVGDANGRERAISSIDRFPERSTVSLDCRNNGRPLDTGLEPDNR